MADELRAKFNLIVLDNKILDKITSYLSLTEQKDFLRTCKFLSQAVRHSRSFHKLSKLLICQKSHEDKVLESCSKIEWKTVSVELRKLPLDALDSIKGLVGKAESVEFHLLNGNNQEMTSLSVPHCMAEIVASAPQLTSLTLDYALMEKELKDVFADTRVQLRLQMLKHLTFVNNVPLQDSFSRLNEFQVMANHVERKIYQIQGTYGLWTRNFNRLLAIRMNLKTLNLGKISAARDTHFNALAAVTNSNSQSVTSLTMSADIWAKGIDNSAFPALKSLKLRAHHKDEHIIRKFLADESEKLENLDVGFVSYFPLSVLTLIFSKISKSKLKTLNLKCKYFVGSLEPFNWNFLKCMDILEEFGLRMPRFVKANHDPEILISPMDYSAIVSNLPKGIRIVTLNGIKCMKGLDQLHYTLLSNLQYLTELNVMNCPEFVDDTLLQLLCSKNSRIQVLKFSYCHNVTVFGLTGMKNGRSTGSSIKNLTSLRELVIRYCPCFQFGDLLRVLNSKHLRTLDVFTVKKITPELFAKLIKENPSLENVSLNLCDQDFIKVTSELVPINSRLSQIIRIMDPVDWCPTVSYYDGNSSSDDNDSSNTINMVEEPPAVAANVALAKRIAARFEELNFDEDVDNYDDLDRFDSEDEDFEGLNMIPG